MNYPPRPTKYRAWTGLQMVVVQSLCFNDKGCLWYGPGTDMGWAFLWPDAQWTKDDPKPDDDTLKPVMQWTGLVDREGREIWEGDLIRAWSEESPYIVRYLDGSFLPSHFLHDGSILRDGWGLDICGTVVGDMYSSPDLVKSVKITTEEDVVRMARAFIR